MSEEKEVFNFSQLSSRSEQLDELPALDSFTARNGTTLAFRSYRATSNTHVILIHGSSAHSVYLHNFAKHLSSQNTANVYTPDLRGHGPNPQRRGDIDYIEQFEADLADLITHLKTQVEENAAFIVGGHSSGGGMALRFCGGQFGNLASGMLLLAPFFGHNAPMVKKNSGGWANPNIPKIIGVSLLNGFGVTRFNSTKVLKFNLPQKYQTGDETLEYSFRLMTGMHPADYRKSLSNSKIPLLILVGDKDEALYADKFEPSVLPYQPDARISVIEDCNHLGITLHETAMREAANWLSNNLPKLGT